MMNANMNTTEKKDMVKYRLLVIIDLMILVMIGVFLYQTNKPKQMFCQDLGDYQICTIYNILGR